MLSNCSAKTSLESFFRSETKFSAQYCEVYLVMYLCNINSADHNRYFRGLKYSGGRFGRGGVTHWCMYSCRWARSARPMLSASN